MINNKQALGSQGQVFRVENATRATVLAEQSRKADKPFTRGIGLMGRKGLPPQGGLIIQPCSSIVSFFMHFPIDVIFVDGTGRVLHVMHAMPPWRTSTIVRGSKFVVELPAETLKRTSTEIGDQIEIRPA